MKSPHQIKKYYIKKAPNPRSPEIMYKEYIAAVYPNVKLSPIQDQELKRAFFAALFECSLFYQETAMYYDDKTAENILTEFNSNLENFFKTIQ
jgi:hypothetical protein